MRTGHALTHHWASTLLLALILAAAACGPQPPAPQAPAQAGQPPSANLAQNQEFRFSLTGEPPGLDPQYASWDPAIAVLSSLFDSLLGFDENFKLVPAVAREVPTLENGGISLDLKTYTYRLRNDVRWNDGQIVTAKDFDYAIRRLFDPDKGSQYASFYFSIVGGKDYFTAKGTRDDPKTPSEAELQRLRDVMGVKALDDFTLQIQVIEPRATFLQLTALWPMFPVRRDMIEAHGDRWTEAGNLIGNGPFRMTEWLHSDHITLVPNEHYYGKKPTLTVITLRMITDANANYAAYLNGELDGTRVPLPNVPQVLSDPELRSQLARGPRLTTFAYQFNVKRPPFDRKEARVAFSKAVDREVYVQSVQRGVGKPAYSWVPPGMPGYQENLGKDVHSFDPAVAKRLLADAGYPEGRGIPPISFQYSNTGDNPLRAQFLQAQLKDNLGIDIILEPMESAAFSRFVNSNQHHIAFVGWTADYPDPDNWLPETFGTGGGNNHTQYSSPQVDEIMRRALSEPDDSRRLQLWSQAQELVVNDTPMIFLTHSEHFLLYKPYVKGLRLTGMDGSSLPGRQFMNEVWIAKQ